MKNKYVVLHRWIFWKIYFWDPKNDHFWVKYQKFQKNYSSSVLYNMITCFNARIRHLRCSCLLWVLIDEKQQRSFASTNFLKNILLGSKKRPFLSKISKISKSFFFFCTVQHDNLFLMLEYDSYDVPAYFEYS